MEIAQTFAEALQRVPAAHLRCAVEHLVLREAAAEAYGLAQRVDLIDLAAGGRFLDPSDDQPETVRSEVDRGK